MVHIKGFATWRPHPTIAHQVHAVPYDVVDWDEAYQLAEKNPYSFLHVSRAEIDLPPTVDPYDPLVYQKAKENLNKLLTQAPYIREEIPLVYIYAQITENHCQTGIVAAVSVDDYDQGIIRRHENTRIDKENDRTIHALTLRAHTGLGFFIHQDNPKIDGLVQPITRREPLYDVTAEDGVRHVIWRCTQEETSRITQEFQKIPMLYIADGHHRTKSASRVREELRKRGELPLDPDAPAHFFPAVIFPASQLKILPYNRLVKTLHGLSVESFLQKVAESFDVTPHVSSHPQCPGEIHAYVHGVWYRLTLRIPYHPPRMVDRLDVAVLQKFILEPILGISDPRTDKRITFVGGSVSPDHLANLVNQGIYQIAFSLFPTTVNQLIAVSNENDLMPPKSTWFYPKLRDGFFVYEF